MKVKEMIALLQTANPEATVIGASDPEGNSFSELSQVEIDPNRVYTDYGSEIELGLASITDEQRKKGWTDEDIMEAGQPCIVIWP